MNLTNTNKETVIMQKRTLVFFVLFLLSSFGMFGQEVNNENGSLEVAPSIEVAYDSEADLVNWFMSSKQNTLNNEVKNDATTTKKQIITSGSQPNKVLYRTFVKRISSKDTAIV